MYETETSGTQQYKKALGVKLPAEKCRNFGEALFLAKWIPE
jgi:hypothetical protein